MDLIKEQLQEFNRTLNQATSWDQIDEAMNQLRNASKVARLSSHTSATKIFMDLIKEKLQEFNRTLSQATSLDQIDGAMSELSGDSNFMAAVDQALQSSLSMKRLRAMVDECCSDIISHSTLVKHSRTKPYGYPGDYEVLEHVYEKAPFNESSQAGKLIDLWALESGLPTAVRQRKNALRHFLQACIQENRKTFLSVGAGTARELRDLPIDKEDVQFDLLDMDARTQTAFNSFGKNTDKATYHIRDVFKDNLDSLKSRYDVVYSFGIFDYLPDKYVNRLVERLKPFVDRDTLFVFALKDASFYNGWFYDLLCDWRFVPRSRHDGFTLARNWGMEVVSTLRTENNAVNVFVCKMK